MTGRRAEEAGIGFARGRLEPAGETGSCMYYVMEGIGYIEKNNQKKDWRCQFFPFNHIRLCGVVFCVIQ